MQQTLSTTEYSRLETFVAKLYVYLLPIRMISPLKFLEPYMPGCVVYTDFWLHVLGMILLWKRNGWKAIVEDDESSRLAHSSFTLACILNISSLIMACIIQLTQGNHGSESAFSGISGMCIYFFQYALMFIYNREVYHILGKDNLMKILRRVGIYLLCLGYLQVMMIVYGGVFAKIHETIDIFNVLLPAEKMTKLSLTGSEGSNGGRIISMLAVPILYASYLEEGKQKYLLCVLLWLIPLYYTRSSTSYICFFVCTVMFLLLLLRYQMKNTKVVLFMIVACIVLALILLNPSILSFISPSLANEIKYLLVEKATDLENGSTVSRTVPLVVNWNTFLEYPILGVGNGLQGYFYEKYFPSWAIHVAGSDVKEFLNRSKVGISNGGLFVPSLLSGYGIIGVGLILYFVYKLVKLAYREKTQMQGFFYVFLMVVVTAFVAGFSGDFYGQYYLWFMLGLPLMTTSGVSYPDEHKYIKKGHIWS